MRESVRNWLLAVARQEPNPYVQGEIFFQIWGWKKHGVLS